MDVSQIAQVTLYLVKENESAETALESKEPITEKLSYSHSSFDVGEAHCEFAYFETLSQRGNPIWLDFVNAQLDSEARISFNAQSKHANGILAIELKGRLLLAAFGRSAIGYIRKSTVEPEFGIKTAMNLCGNEEIRQTRTQSNTITTTHIDRQVSRPSDTFVFGLSESEDLRYIAAHLKDDKSITLQGRDSLTLRVIGDEKFSWPRLIKKCGDFLDKFGSNDYAELFPNFRNFMPVSVEQEERLDELLVLALRERDYTRLSLSVPEFFGDENIAFSFSARKKRNNDIYSFLEASLLTEVFDEPGVIDVPLIKRRRIYAYSYETDQIYESRYWTLYDCLVYEVELHGEYFTLSAGRWCKVDSDFYQEIAKFVKDRLRVEPAEPIYSNVPIGNNDTFKNEEAIFNAYVVGSRPTAILFDRSKLRIGTGRKDKEFCDILDMCDDGRVRIINAKQFKDSSSLNYLFSQAKFYVEAFLNDDVFLGEIRCHIEASPSSWKQRYLEVIKDDVALNVGSDFTVCLWLLYDGAQNAPTKDDIPLIAQYELKLMHDHMRKSLKVRDIVLRFIPVVTTKFAKVKSGIEPAQA